VTRISGGWEQWLRSHLDSEREITDDAITEMTRELVHGTLAGIDARDDKVVGVNRDLRWGNSRSESRGCSSHVAACGPAVGASQCVG
jgi:hypothetical protein